MFWQKYRSIILRATAVHVLAPIVIGSAGILAGWFFPDFFIEKQYNDGWLLPCGKIVEHWQSYGEAFDL